jgi:hypothetical protein
LSSVRPVDLRQKLLNLGIKIWDERRVEGVGEEVEKRERQ